MELDTNSLDGHWAKDNNLGVEFFIINDAVFSKLCILGDDVEPCFEGSSVTATSSEVSDVFSINKNFSHTLYSMMKELTDALKSKGGLEMPNEFAEQTNAVEEESTEKEFAAEEVVEETVDHTDADEAIETEATEEFAEEEDNKEESESAEEFTSEEIEEEEESESEAEFSLEDYNALAAENESLRAEIESLREFKLTVENEQKDALFEKFPYNTLSEEDVKDVKEHKSDYSLDEIKSKLAVIYVEKGVQFTAQETEESVEEDDDEEAISTFSLDGEITGPMSALQEALRNTVH